VRPAEAAKPEPARLKFTALGLGWVAVTVFVGAVSWYKSINLVLLLVYAMVGMLFVNAYFARRAARRADAARVPVPPVFAGERAECGVTVRNASQFPVTVTAEDRAGGGSANTFFVYRLPAGHELTCTAAKEFPRRGRVKGPVALTSAVPFGFLECERLADTGGEIVVLPKLGVADADGLRRWVLRYAGGDGWAMRAQRRASPDAAEVRGVREYRTGDALRDIHWRTTARRGEPMVREYDRSPSPDLVLVVEPWLPTNPTDADRANLEAALSLAATIAVTWRRAFDVPVTIAVAGASGPPATATSDEDLREALTPLADAEGSPNPDPLPAEAFGRKLSAAARVLVSSRARSPFATVLARATGKTFVAVGADERPAWYHPPTPAV
jgi:uncharacterized protein (DUF58 family)